VKNSGVSVAVVCTLTQITDAGLTLLPLWHTFQSGLRDGC
jgi:hypothetical protein